MNIIAYIPARGGSRRIPKKNIRLLGGKPVIVHVIDALHELDFLKGICVSTDDEEIADISRQAGAVVLGLRCAELSDDQTDLKDLLKYDVLRHLQHFEIEATCANVLLAVATAALVKPVVYQQAFQVFQEEKHNLLVATVKYPISPYWALTQISAGQWVPLFPEMLMVRSQDLPKTQVDAGLFYFLNYHRIVNHQKHWLDAQEGLICFPVPSSMAVDVDTLSDWSELEEKYARWLL